MNKEEEENSWSIKLNHEFKVKMKPFETPRFKQALLFVPFTLRYKTINIFNILKACLIFSTYKKKKIYLLSQSMSKEKHSTTYGLFWTGKM